MVDFLLPGWFKGTVYGDLTDAVSNDHSTVNGESKQLLENGNGRMTGNIRLWILCPSGCLHPRNDQLRVKLLRCSSTLFLDGSFWPTTNDTESSAVLLIQLVINSRIGLACPWMTIQGLRRQLIHNPTAGQAVSLQVWWFFSVKVAAQADGQLRVRVNNYNSHFRCCGNSILPENSLVHSNNGFKKQLRLEQRQNNDWVTSWQMLVHKTTLGMFPTRRKRSPNKKLS